MRLATMTYTFTVSNSPPPSERIPQIAAECGVEGLNWVGTCGLSPEQARRLTLDAGLEVSCYTVCPDAFRQGRPRGEALDEVRRRIEEAGRMGAPCLMVVPLPPGNSPDRTYSQRRWVDFLREIVPMAEAIHAVLTVENFEGVGSPFVTAAELLELRRHVPSLRFTFDAGNAAMGEDPVACARQLAGGIAYVHLQDWTVFPRCSGALIPGLDGRGYAKELIGEGVLDFPAILRELKRQNYAGFLDIEYAAAKYTAREAVVRAVRYLKRML